MSEKISVIIPARGKAVHLKGCLKSLLDLDYQNYQIVIVDDGLNRQVREFIRSQGQKISLIDSEGKGPSLARNLAAKASGAEFIAFTDSDCLADKDWLSELLKGFKEYPDAVACGGRQGLPQDAADFEKKVFLFMKKSRFFAEYSRQAGGSDIKEVNHNASCCVMYKRDVFLKEGGFLRGLWPGEDVELDYRLKKRGYKIIFNPRAVVYHYRPKNLKKFLEMMYRYGWAQGFLVRKYGIFRKIQIIPFLSPAVLSIFAISPFIGFILLPVLGLIILWLVLAFYFRPAILPLALAGVMFWNLGFLKKLILNK
jgi:GT2 family glycosyltransferase